MAALAKDVRDARIARIRKMLKAGMYLKDMASEIGIHPSTLDKFSQRHLPEEHAQWRSKYNKQFWASRAPEVEALFKTIEADILAGMSFQKAANKLGMSQPRFTKWVRRLRPEWRKHNPVIQKWENAQSKYNKVFADLRTGELSLTKIAARHGISISTVGRLRWLL